MGMRTKLIISYLLIIIFTVAVLGFFVVKKSRDTVFKEVTQNSEHISELIYDVARLRSNLLSEKIQTDLIFAEKLLYMPGQMRIDYSQKIHVTDIDLPVVYFGDDKVSLNNNLVDEIKKSTGAICSIFLLHNNKLIRIATNLTINGTRSLGTFIDSNSEIYKKIINNEPYMGRIYFENDWFITGYKPLVDENNKVIGSIALGHKEVNQYFEETLNNIKIGNTGYVYIMDSNGSVIFHPEIKGENLKGLDFSKKIIETKNGVLEYTFEGVHRLAYYRYFEPWDWYIVVTAKYDDLKSSSRSIMNVTLLVGLIIFMISSIIAFFMTNAFIKPINKLKRCMEIAGKGDLTVHSEIKSKDEIGVLSKTFNNMVKENKRLLDDVMQYDKLKTEFIANISHEFRTPLNIIFSTVQMFSENHNENNQLNSDKQNRYISIMKQNCYRLLRLVNNLIDITKIDSGFMELSLKNKNIVEVVENISLSTAEYVENMSRTIVFDTDVEEKIMAIDMEKMEKIILNLISNALKFTKPGDSIEIKVSDMGDTVEISVKDTGVGIPDDQLEKVFERFKQVDNLLSRRNEGSGIGLSLVKSFVEMQGGSISVISKQGEGSEFIIELPVKLIAEDNSKEISDDAIYQAKVEKIQIEFSDIYT